MNTNVQMNTLFVTADGAYLQKDHSTLVVRQAGEVKAQVPMLHLAGVVCFGGVMVSPELMSALTEAGTHVAFFSRSGRFQARVEGIPGGNVMLRRVQYRAADEVEQSLGIAKAMVAGKITNARQFLMHARRDAPDEERRERLARGSLRLALHLRQVMRAGSMDEVRGHEGIAARDYFEAFDALIKRPEEEFRFRGRSRRPPKDRVNALLSFGYALLMQDCAGALAGVGLDPAVGYLHEERSGRLSLALDMMEELRVPVVDRLVVAMVNRQQVAVDDFVAESAGGYRLTDDARKAFLTAYQEAKQGEVRHGFLDEVMMWGRVPHIQALLLARALRGDLDGYAPFTMR